MSPWLGKRLTLAGLALAGICVVSIPVTIAVLLSATGASGILSLEGFSPLNDHQAPVRSVPAARCVPEHGYFALTFDDGPDPETTPRLVAALKRARAVATFFDVGARAAAHQRLVDLQRTVGEVASHSWSDIDLSELSSSRRVWEFQKAAKALDYPNVYFRPPYGESGAAVQQDIARTGLTPVYWTIDAGDLGLPRAAVVARALQVRAGGIVLLHDVSGTAGVVGEIVARLRERGMCPGLLGETARTVVAANGARFNVIAVRP